MYVLGIYGSLGVSPYAGLASPYGLAAPAALAYPRPLGLARPIAHAAVAPAGLLGMKCFQSKFNLLFKRVEIDDFVCVIFKFLQALPTQQLQPSHICHTQMVLASAMLGKKKKIVKSDRSHWKKWKPS